MDFKVRFLPADITVSVPSDSTIMDAERKARLSFEYPCGGNGTCGKCMVQIHTAEGTKTVKACTEKVTCDMTVTLTKSVAGKQADKVLLSSKDTLSEVCPGIRVIRMSVPEAVVGDSRSDFERFSSVCKEEYGFDTVDYNSVSVLSSLSGIFAKDIFTFNAVFYSNTLIDIRTDDFTPLGLAYDIGTTTVACYLVNLITGEEISSIGSLNKQVKYGGDVISRCIYASDTDMDEIHKCITGQVDEMAKEILEANNCKSEDVYAVSVVGNTCMHHIFAGISPVSLINVPYTPSCNETMILHAESYLSSVNKNAKILLLPVIAGFVGADTVSAILATDFPQKENITLLLDIGTNGEMALGNKERWVSCSTASGPAFEGAKITCGMRGAPGAIDHVEMKDGSFTYSTIENKKPVGICGSGIIDAISIMLDEEVILPSGRFNKAYAKDESMLARFDNIDGQKCFVLATADETETGKPVYITQKDIREVQLAKGAIAAGIEIMAERIGAEYDEIHEILIAGAFGNYMRPKSMCRIKMIPENLQDRIVPVGNAAGSGAKICVLNKKEFENSETISQKTEFIELATHEHFQEKFIKQLDF